MTTIQLLQLLGLIAGIRKLAGEEKCKLCEDVANSGSGGGWGYIDNFGKFHTHTKVATASGSGGYTSPSGQGDSRGD